MIIVNVLCLLVAMALYGIAANRDYFGIPRLHSWALRLVGLVGVWLAIGRLLRPVFA